MHMIHYTFDGVLSTNTNIKAPIHKAGTEYRTGDPEDDNVFKVPLKQMEWIMLVSTSVMMRTATYFKEPVGENGNAEK